MNFEYLRTPAAAASLLVLAGILMLLGVFFSRIARQRPGLQLSGLATPVAFLAGGVYVVLGLYLLYTAPNHLIQIESAIYGRPQPFVPTLPLLPVATLDCTSYARSVCDAHANCSLRFSNQACGRDPDQGSWKVAEVVYRCGNEPPTRAFAVESRPASLVCK